MKKAIFRELHKSMDKVEKLIDEAIEDMSKTNENENKEVLVEETTKHSRRRKKEVNE